MKNFFIVMPLDEAAQAMAERESDRDQLRALVWSQAAESMKALLGRTCSQFAPAPAPGDGINALPYGVALGAVEPMEFLVRYSLARMAQERELEARQQKILSLGHTVFSGQISDSIKLAVMAASGDNPEIYRELELDARFWKHDITAAAGLYFLAPDRCAITKAEEQRMLSHIFRYAICAAELVPMEVRT
ncbi:MAG: hypothetical protein HFF18_06295 [Oscillospiraceae bacterium]|nr:hypothetical protein [Oscillospiraceae bacterium]